MHKQLSDKTKAAKSNTAKKAAQQPSSQGEQSQPTRSFLTAKQSSPEVIFANQKCQTQTQSTTATSM